MSSTFTFHCPTDYYFKIVHVSIQLRAVDCLVCSKNFSYLFLRDIFLAHSSVQKDSPAPYLAYLKSPLQPLCGRPHQKQLGAGPCSLLP